MKNSPPFSFLRPHRGRGGIAPVLWGMRLPAAFLGGAASSRAAGGAGGSPATGFGDIAPVLCLPRPLPPVPVWLGGRRAAHLILLSLFTFHFSLFTSALADAPPHDTVLLGDLDLAEQTEILRNQFRRITPDDVPLVQDIGTLPAAFDLFSPAWDSAPVVRSLATWLVPFSVSLENGLTVARDADGDILWQGPVDFSRPESAAVTIVGTLVAENDFPLYEATRDEIARRLAPPPSLPRSHPATNALRFTSLSLDTNGILQLDLAAPVDGPVEIFARSMAYTSSVVTVVWTNDENTVVTNTSTQWQQAPGEAFRGTSDVWTYLGLATVSNGIASFPDPAITNDDYRVCFYVAQPFADSDSDGVSDAAERWTWHTDPHNPDTDGDGLSDGAEVSMGFEPGNPNDCPKIMLHAVFYNPSGTDTGQEWVELYSASTRSVDLSGTRLEIGRSTGWTTAAVFPQDTSLAPGRSLLVGEALVTNADLSATLDIPNAWTNEPTTGLRLCWNTAVIDTVFIGGEESFNSAQLDTTGWLSTNSVWAHAGAILERRYPGVDTDRAADWHEVVSRAGRNSSSILDFDADGIPDGDEWTGDANPFGEPTNPWNPDSDGDGLSDHTECLVHLTNPNTWATDGDIYPFMPPGTPPASWPGTDSYELAHNGDPSDPDENSNGIPDSWEAALPPDSLDGIVDSDSDGIDNLSELLQNSNPLDSSDSSSHPFVLVFESSAPGWVNGAPDNDVGLGGFVNVHFLGAEEGTMAGVSVEEGNVLEEFGLLWFGTDSGHASVQGTFGIASADIGSGTFLRIFDTASHPDFTDTLGGEYTVSAFGMAIENIKFNHDPASSEHDALNIRQDHSVPFDISTGEWVKDGQNLPVAYCMNCSVAIKARFSVFPASVTTADIWATPLAANSSLGGVQRTTIHFANGISVGDEDGFVELPVLGKTPTTIGKTCTDQWKWFADDINGTQMSVNFAQSGPHTIYTVFAAPQPPWDNLPGVSSNAWTTALDFALLHCGVNGSSTASAALADITSALYAIPYAGNAQCQSASGFNYTGFMQTPLANCLDSASGLDTTASLLGIDIQARRRTRIFGFNFHCFTIASGNVYDSCSAMSSVVLGTPYDDYLQAASPEPGSIEINLSLRLE